MIVFNMGVRMPDAIGQVRPIFPAKMDVSANLVAGWSRIMARIGRGTFVDHMAVDRKVIERTIGTGNMPHLDTVLNSLLIDPTALDEVFALYGFGLHRLPHRDHGGLVGQEELGDVIDLASAMSAFERGNPNDHRAKIALSEKARPVAQVACGIVAEADRLRGVAA